MVKDDDSQEPKRRIWASVSTWRASGWCKFGSLVAEDLGSMGPGSPDSYGGRILRQAGGGGVLIKKRKTLRMPKGLGAVHSSHPRAGSGSIGDAAPKMQRCTFASFYRTKTSLSRGASWS